MEISLNAIQFIGLTAPPDPSVQILLLDGAGYKLLRFDHPKFNHSSPLINFVKDLSNGTEVEIAGERYRATVNKGPITQGVTLGLRPIS